MEQAFGADFSGVKVHTNGQSDQLNRSIQARAFTTGQDVFFREGEYNPGMSGRSGVVDSCSAAEWGRRSDRNSRDQEKRSKLHLIQGWVSFLKRHLLLPKGEGETRKGQVGKPQGRSGSPTYTG